MKEDLIDIIFRPSKHLFSLAIGFVSGIIFHREVIKLLVTVLAFEIVFYVIKVDSWVFHDRYVINIFYLFGYLLGFLAHSLTD